MNVSRSALLAQIRASIARNPVTVLIGARQVGKTTLARTLLDENSPNYFDLEDPVSLRRLDEPMTALAQLEGLVIIDEIQRRPDLFQLLRVLADRRPQSARFLILGSASGDLMRQSAETLAGRMERIEVSGFTLAELGEDSAATLWRRGGFPRAFLVGSERDSVAWREQFVRTLLEREFPQWGLRVPAVTLLRFWTMIAHYHGRIWNASVLGRALGVSATAVRHYLDLLSDALMVRQLRPWHVNVRKRQVKAPKVYIRDSGLLHQLLGLETERALLSHPVLGASWEGFVIEQVLATESFSDAWFWATHQGAEIDLLLRQGDRLFGVECKRADAPKITPSIRIALEDLGLEQVVVVYPGARRYRLSESVEAAPLAALAEPGQLFTRA